MRFAITLLRIATVCALRAFAGQLAYRYGTNLTILQSSSGRAQISICGQNYDLNLLCSRGRRCTRAGSWEEARVCGLIREISTLLVRKLHFGIRQIGLMKKPIRAFLKIYEKLLRVVHDPSPGKTHHQKTKVCD